MTSRTRTTPRRRTRRIAAGTLAVAGVVAVTYPATAESGSGGDRPPRPEPPRCSTAVEERNLATFEDYLATLISGDTAGAQEYYTDDAVVEVHGSVAYAGTWSIQDGAYTDALSRYWAPPTGGGSAPGPTLWVDCDQVILRGVFERTAAETGEPVSTEVIEFFTFRNGEMTRDDFYFADTAAVQEALEAD